MTGAGCCCGGGGGIGGGGGRGGGGTSCGMRPAVGGTGCAPVDTRSSARLNIRRPKYIYMMACGLALR